VSSPVRSLTNLARGTRSRCLRSFIASSVQLAGRGVGKTRCGAEFIRSRMCALRTGTHPQVVVTTTPRPIKLIKDLVRDPRTVLTRGSTWDNALNLASTFIHRIGDDSARADLLDFADRDGAVVDHEP
jgi:phage terminase large subunit-like protein